MILSAALAAWRSLGPACLLWGRGGSCRQPMGVQYDCFAEAFRVAPGKSSSPTYTAWPCQWRAWVHGPTALCRPCAGRRWHAALPAR
eukprot:12236220-Alexandrium_andersonii.AAC.1